MPGLENDFNKYLDANPSNRRVEELGIGTNEGVKDCMHAMPGSKSAIAACIWAWAAAQKGSHHLDLIFNSGTLAVDKSAVFEGRFVLNVK